MVFLCIKEQVRVEGFRVQEVEHRGARGVQIRWMLCGVFGVRF